MSRTEEKPKLTFTSLVTRPAPDFTAETVYGNGDIKPLTLSSFKGKKYVCLFFYPLDFTFVCPSEIIAFDKALDKFAEKNCEVIGVSVDSHFCHFAWRNTPVKQGGIGPIKYPLVSDLSKKISKDYGVLTQDDTVSLRGLFILDKEQTVQHALVNNLPLGRSVDEALRILDALQHFETKGEVCPANWAKGKEAMKPDSKGVAEYLSKNA